MEFKRVGKKAKAKWRLSRSIFIVFLLIPLAITILSYIAEPETGMLIGMIVCAVLVLLQLLNIIVYPIIEYIQWEYMITDDRIEIKKGIIFKSHTVLPISRIQHVCAKQGPIQRMFKLGTIEIMTAAGMHTIQELDFETAEEICELLHGYIKRKLEQLEKKEKVSADA